MPLIKELFFSLAGIQLRPEMKSIPVELRYREDGSRVSVMDSRDRPRIAYCPGLRNHFDRYGYLGQIEVRNRHGVRFDRPEEVIRVMFRQTILFVVLLRHGLTLL